jgi:hypothetical protein
MKTLQRTCIIGFFLAATPAMAGVHPVTEPIANHVLSSLQQAIPAPAPLLEPAREETRETSLPLECRGFYLQQTRPALSRCN